MNEHDMLAYPHIPALLQEVLDGLHCAAAGLFIDGTVGCGGHAEAILNSQADSRVIGIDRDAAALEIARRRLARFGERISLHHARHEAFEDVLRAWQAAHHLDNLPQPDGILFDLGVSSLQFDTPERGFSFQQSAWLDMRMDRPPDGGAKTLTAHDVVNAYDEAALADIFFQYGEERQARRIARKIVEARKTQPISTTTELAQIVDRAIPKQFQQRGIHPATRVFQAIRIEVNGELRELDATLERAVSVLKTGGRLCVISFHSLEDRIVKQTCARLAKGCVCPPDFPICVCGKLPTLNIVTKKPIIPSDSEQRANPRSRSAKLRIVEKIETVKRESYE